MQNGNISKIAGLWVGDCQFNSAKGHRRQSKIVGLDGLLSGGNGRLQVEAGQNRVIKMGNEHRIVPPEEVANFNVKTEEIIQPWCPISY